jgi:predicted HAD superfamily Cof-like phosphohydrolase
MPFTSVVTFQKEILGNHSFDKGLLSDAEMDITMNLLNEEIQEFEDAHDSSDYIGCIDAVIDLLYFGVGALHKLGLSEDEMVKCFAAVHDANMTKKKGIVERRGDGTVPDAIKPADWVAPEERIAAIIGGANHVA